MTDDQRAARRRAVHALLRGQRLYGEAEDLLFREDRETELFSRVIAGLATDAETEELRSLGTLYTSAQSFGGYMVPEGLVGRIAQAASSGPYPLVPGSTAVRTEITTTGGPWPAPVEDSAAALEAAVVNQQAAPTNVDFSFRAPVTHPSKVGFSATVNAEAALDSPSLVEYIVGRLSEALMRGINKMATTNRFSTAAATRTASDGTPPAPAGIISVIDAPNLRRDRDSSLAASAQRTATGDANGFPAPVSGLTALHTLINLASEKMPAETWARMVPMAHPKTFADIIQLRDSNGRYAAQQLLGTQLEMLAAPRLNPALSPTGSGNTGNVIFTLHDPEAMLIRVVDGSMRVMVSDVPRSLNDQLSLTIFWRVDSIPILPRSVACLVQAAS